MKKIMLFLFSIFLMLGLVSCDGHPDEDNQNLLEQVKDRLDATFYSYHEGSILLKDYLRYYLLEDQYDPVECLVVRRENLSTEGDVWIYSFEKGTDVEGLKNHLVSHTIQNENKYAVCDNLLFLTRQETQTIRHLAKVFSLTFETGKLNINSNVKIEKNCIGISKEQELQNANDFKLFYSYEDFESFKEKLLSHDIYKYDSENLEILESFNASDFETKNLLFLQMTNDIPFDMNGFEPALSPMLNLSNQNLEVINLVKINLFSQSRSGYTFCLCLIDKSVSFSQTKYSFYDYRIHLDYLFEK